MAAVHSPEYRTLASLSRINLLHALQRGQPLTREDLASATGLHRNTVREHLQRLIAAGFVHAQAEHTPTRGRPRMLYSTTVPADDPDLQARVRRAVDAGRRVRALAHAGSTSAAGGHAVDTHAVDTHSASAVAPDEVREDIRRQLDVLEEHMDRCGFDSAVDADEMLMTMHHCPFAELARENPQVCEVHFGLVRDRLAETVGPVQARQLHPFHTTATCTLELRAEHTHTRE